jgi:hypothetical protein
MSNAISLYNKRPDPFLPVFAAPDNGKLMITTKERFEKESRSDHSFPLKDITDERLASWFPKDGDKLAQTLPRLLGLYRAVMKEKHWNTRLTYKEMMPVVRTALKDGRLVVFFEEKFETLNNYIARTGENGGVDKVSTYEDAVMRFTAYAKHLGIDIGEKAKVPESNRSRTLTDGQKATIYEGSNEHKGLKDTTSDECPSDNYRSESVDTVSPTVRKWFGGDDNLAKYGDGILGFEEGGGFLRSTTHVIRLPEGSVFWRYCAKGTEKGCWVFFFPLDGDPRVFAALPETSPGTDLVECTFLKGTTPEDRDVLVGLGAPRCSNKPGGPIQICLKHSIKEKLQFL